jgi:hypothetical protein
MPRNPFKDSRRRAYGEDGRDPETGMELGHIRGTYAVRKYSAIKKAPRWGVEEMKPRQNICYHKGQLGIALCWQTGEIETVDRLTAYKSQYLPRDIERV